MRSLLHKVPVPRGDDADYFDVFLFDAGLAGEAGGDLDVAGLVDPVALGVAGFAHVLAALGDPDVAGGAGADAATGVFDFDVRLFAQSDFEERLALDRFLHQFLLVAWEAEGLRVLHHEPDFAVGGALNSSKSEAHGPGSIGPPAHTAKWVQPIALQI